MVGPTPIVIDLVEDSRIARDLVTGSAHLAVCDQAPGEYCELVVRAASKQLVLAGRVVARDGHGGASIELVNFDAALAAEIEALWLPQLDDEIDAALGVLDERTYDPPSAPLTISFRGDAQPEPVLDHDARHDVPYDPDDSLAITLESPVVPGGDLLLELEPLTEPEAARFPDDVTEDLELDELEAPTGRRTLPRNVHERLRGLTLAQQIKKANSADPSERMMLERMYGKNVWEALLRNPRLTPPEVARIARMGMLPRLMLEQIVGNAAWLQIPEIRRALLSNPRLGTDQILRVLRLLPKHELKLASVQTAYPAAVRDAAKRMLRATNV